MCTTQKKESKNEKFNKIYLIYFFWVLCLIQFGCGTIQNELSTIEVLTNYDTYNIDSTATIKLLITNNSTNPIYYICSGDIYIEEIKEWIVIEEWKVYGFEECLAIRSIEPKKTKEYYFMYKSEPSVFKLQDAEYSKNAKYRFRIDFYYNQNPEAELTTDDKYSNKIYILK